MLKDRIVYLLRPQDVANFLKEYPTSIIFKAGGCHKTMQGFGFLQEWLEPKQDLMTGVIKVLENRPASDYVTERTQIIHHSPQVIVFKDGVAVFEVNNWQITPETLKQGFEKIPQNEANTEESQKAQSDLSVYIGVLSSYNEGEIDDRQFEKIYTDLFRRDASLRSAKEVEILNSIFGDIHQHKNMHTMMAGKTADFSDIRKRAGLAFERLKAI